MKIKEQTVRENDHDHMNREDVITRLRETYPPGILAVELTNSCNLRCPLCSTGTGINPKAKGMMSFKHFKTFMDECAPLMHMVGFIGSGEPMLHPQFIKFVKYAALEKNKMTMCCTNGTVLKKPKAIVKSGLQTLYVDVDGVTDEQHRVYRVGANLKTVLDNVKGLVAAKKKLRSPYPEIYIDTLISKHNEKDYETFIALAKETGADGIRFETIKEDLFGTADWVPETAKFKLVERKENEYTCMFKETLAGILSWDGDMQLCCMTPNHKEPVIKLNAFREEHLPAKLDSPSFLQMTRRAGDYPFCSTCFLKNYTGYQETIHF